MKVLITSLYNGHVNRGIESWAYQIFKYLRRNGLEVKLLQGGSDIPAWVEDQDDIVTNITPLPTFGDDTRFASKVRRRLKVHQSDFVARRFLQRTTEHLLRSEPDIVLPMSGGIPSLR